MAAYDQVGRHLRLHQQKSHYRRIVFAKKNIDFQQFEQKTLACIRPNHKYGSFRQREIKNANLKLYSRLLSIQKKKGLLQTLEDDIKPKKQTADSFKTFNNSLDEKINRENIKLVQRLSEVRALVGNRKQWQREFKKSRSLKRKLHRYVKNESLDPDVYIRQTITALSHRRPKDRKIHTSLADKNPQHKLNGEKPAEGIKNLQEWKYRTEKRKVKQNEEKKKEMKVPIKSIILSKGLEGRFTTSSQLDDDLRRCQC